MANLSQEDRNIIAEHPLEKYLDHLQDPLRKAEHNNKPGSLSHNGIVNRPDQGPQKAISRLLGALQVHEVAFDLQSKTGGGDVASELSALFRRVRNSNFNYEHYHSLSRLVVKKATDVDI